MTTNFHNALDSNAEPDDMNAFDATPSGRAQHVFTPQLVANAEARVAESGVLDKLAVWRGDDNQTAGVTESATIVSDRAILVGLLLLASEHSPLDISCLAEVFQHRLTSESRALLGLPSAASKVAAHVPDRKRWYSHTRTAFNRIIALMDPYPQDRSRTLTYTEVQTVLEAHDPERSKMMKTRLDEFTNGFLQMTFNHQPQHLRAATSRIDVSFDQLFITSPTSKGFSRKTLAKNVADEVGVDPRFIKLEHVDVDAGWYVRGGNAGRTNFAWGWTVNVAVRVDSKRPSESRFPELAVSAALSLPNVGVADEAVTLMSTALNSTGLSAGVADADKQYFPNARVERLHEPTYALGFTPSTDYPVEQLGVHGGKAGAEFIEGKVYCPSMPQPFKDASKERRNGRIDEKTYQFRLRARRAFELRPKGKPDSHGRVRMMCPAAGASPTVTCPLRVMPAGVANKLRPPVAQEDLPDFAEKICTQQSVTFEKEDGMRLRQAFDYRSPEWHEFHRHARHSIEALSARLNDPSRENIGDASRRNVRGFAAAQVFVTILLTNYNLRTIAVFIAKRISADNDKEQGGASDTIGRPNTESPTPDAGPSSSRAGSTVEPDGNAPTP